MSKSTASALRDVLNQLSEQASARGLTDTDWAERAGMRKETLSRLRRREDCDFSTLHALAGALGAHIGITEGARAAGLSPDGHFPQRFLRDYEEQLVELVASGNRDPGAWRALGPPFFMAGLAVLMASDSRAPRAALISLAEQLHPGIGEPAIFSRWLERSPIDPARFFSLVESGAYRAA